MTELSGVDAHSGEDTSGKGAKAPIPTEAVAVEHIVGLLDLERAGGAKWTAAELNEQAAGFATARGWPAPRLLTDAALAGIRTRLRELFALWAALAPGATREISFDRPASEA